MAVNDSKKKKDIFEQALKGKRLPVLTLDNKWYRLLDELGKNAVKEIEEQLNDLLKRQGRLNSEMKDLKRLKMKLMGEIVPMVDEASQGAGAELDRKIEENKRLIEECNEKMEEHKDELMDLPTAIDQMNYSLMLETMEYCYHQIQENTSEINEIEAWVAQIRVELKKRLVKKQMMEQKNHDIYSYMHDIFGAEVVDLFDLAYNPEEKHPKASGEKKND